MNFMNWKKSYSEVSEKYEDVFFGLSVFEIGGNGLKNGSDGRQTIFGLKNESIISAEKNHTSPVDFFEIWVFENSEKYGDLFFGLSVF